MILTFIKQSAILLFLAFLNMQCNQTKSKQEEKIASPEITEKGLTKQDDMEECIAIDSVLFEGKPALMRLLDENIEYIDGRGGGLYDLGYTDESIRYIFPLVSNYLKKKGYQRPSKEEFEQKMHEFFGLIPDKNSNCFIQMNKYKSDYLEYMMYDDKTDESNVYLIGGGSLIFVPEHQFIYRVFSRPPYIYDSVVTVENGRRYTCIAPENYHYNRFFFNDSQSSLTWLINNDLDFLELLVREFGYDKNDKINKAVIEKVSEEYKTDENAIITLFAKKDCSGNLQIREGLMKFISNNYEKDHNTPMKLLNYYAYNIITHHYDHALSFTPQDYLKIAAYAGYYQQLARYRNDMDRAGYIYYTFHDGWEKVGFLSTFLDNDDYGFLEEIKKNNYYNLSGFEEMLDDILQKIDEGKNREYDRAGESFDDIEYQEQND